MTLLAYSGRAAVPDRHHPAPAPVGDRAPAGAPGPGPAGPTADVLRDLEPRDFVQPGAPTPHERLAELRAAVPQRGPSLPPAATVRALRRQP